MRCWGLGYWGLGACRPGGHLSFLRGMPDQIPLGRYNAAVQGIVDFVTLRAADVAGFLAEEE